jgi:hypothetical protein
MKRTFVMLTASAALSVGLVACPSPQPPIKTDFGQPTTIEGTITDLVERPNNPAVVEFRNKTGFLLSKTNANNNGTFSLALPSADLVTSKLESSEFSLFFFALIGSSGENCTGDLSLTPIVNTFTLSTLGFTQGSFETDRKISSGDVGVVNGVPNVNQNMWIFATDSTKFSGTRMCADFKVKANLFLKKGWNVANVKFSEKNLVVESIEPAATNWRTNPNFLPL